MLWGIDLGGTKIECAVINGIDNPEVVVRDRIPSDADKGYEHVMNQIKKLVDQTSDKLGIKPEKIGMGTPGSLDPDAGLLKNSNSVVLNHKPFLKDIQEVLGIQVTIANDANCFALAETIMGAVPKYSPDANVVFGVIIGTGVGGGIVIDGKVVNGRHGIGGEWGHNFLDESGGECYCGKSGCVERIISGPALEKYYHALSNNKKRLLDIAEAHEKGDDSAATRTMERLVHFFGLGLSNVINILDPDIILIGGGIGNVDLIYTKGIEEVEKYVFNTSFHTPIKRPLLGDSAGVFGAAFLVAD